MPQYEYICEEDGEVVTLLRPMRDADKPVEDPQGRGRRFVRRHSTFSVAGSSSTPAPAPHRHTAARHGESPVATCPCGNPHGPCQR